MDQLTLVWFSDIRCEFASRYVEYMAKGDCAQFAWDAATPMVAHREEDNTR